MTCKWWGYLHINGTNQVKRFFRITDLDDARESDVVLAVTWVVDATGRDDALRQAEEILK